MRREEVDKPNLFAVGDRTWKARRVEDMYQGIEALPRKCGDVLSKISPVMEFVFSSQTEEGDFRKVIGQIQLITEGSICTAIE